MLAHDPVRDGKVYNSEPRVSDKYESSVVSLTETLNIDTLLGDGMVVIRVGIN
jgi:hypothetical protein